MVLAGCETVVWTFIGLASNISSTTNFVCDDGREVSYGNTPDGQRITVDGVVVPMELQSVPIDEIYDEATYWLGRDLILDTRHSRETGRATLYDLGPDGQPIEADGVECRRAR